jgi:hypothetical protein
MELDYFAPEPTGERFHETINRRRAETWLAKSALGFFVLDREAGSFFPTATETQRRQKDPPKSRKITDEDWRNREK